MPAADCALETDGSPSVCLMGGPFIRGLLLLIESDMALGIAARELMFQPVRTSAARYACSGLSLLSDPRLRVHALSRMPIN